MFQKLHLSAKTGVFQCLTITVAVLIGLGVVSGTAFPAGKRPLKRAEVGLPAPDFTLKDEEGKSHTLTDYRGKVVVLEWTDPDCQIVKGYYSRQDGIDDTALHSVALFGVQWFAINSNHYNTPEQTKRWRALQAIPFQTLMDTTGKIAKRYQVEKTPTVFVIDPRGVLRYRGAIDDDPEGVKNRRLDYVRSALKAVFDNKEVHFKQTETVGCPVRFKP